MKQYYIEAKSNFENSQKNQILQISHDEFWNAQKINAIPITSNQIWKMYKKLNSSFKNCDFPACQNLDILIKANDKKFYAQNSENQILCDKSKMKPVDEHTIS